MSVKQIYTQLIQEPSSVIGQSVDINDKEQVIKTINSFLEQYPKTVKPAPDAPWVDLSLRDLTKQSLETAINIIEDISAVISQREQLTNTEIRRQLVHIFFRAERRISVGLWLIFLSFIIYFIDSTV